MPISQAGISRHKTWGCVGNACAGSEAGEAFFRMSRGDPERES